MGQKRQYSNVQSPELSTKSDLCGIDKSLEKDEPQVDILTKMTIIIKQHSEAERKNQLYLLVIT